MEGATDTLPVSEVHDILHKAMSNYAGNIFSFPPVQPASYNLYNFGDVEAQWELKKKFRFVFNG